MHLVSSHPSTPRQRSPCVLSLPVKRITKPLAVLLLVLVLVTGIVIAWRHHLEERAREKREAAYELARRTYADVLRPGMTRKQVEDYLRDKKIPFRQMCCVEGIKKHAWDDLTKIGQEEVPWVCSENNVYVAFQFDDRGEHKHPWDANDLDSLHEVTVFHWLEGCL
jgi:hypothetical protein